jgi:hypothetical protein
LCSEGPHRDEDCARLINNGAPQRYVGEPVVLWIEQCAARWAHSPPEWCTAEWRTVVLEHAHLLPGDGAARVALAMSSIAESDVGDGNGTVDDAAGLGHIARVSSSTATRGEAEWGCVSPLVV